MCPFFFFSFLFSRSLSLLFFLEALFHSGVTDWSLPFGDGLGCGNAQLVLYVRENSHKKKQGAASSEAAVEIHTAENE